MSRDASESRKRRRHWVTTACMVTNASGTLVADETVDASWESIHVRACASVRHGERVKVALKVPRHDFWIHGEGVVARLIHGRRGDDDGPSFAIRLDVLDGMDRLILGRTLPRFPVARGERRRSVGVAARRSGPTRDYASAIARIARVPDHPKR